MSRYTPAEKVKLPATWSVRGRWTSLKRYSPTSLNSGATASAARTPAFWAESPVFTDGPSSPLWTPRGPYPGKEAEERGQGEAILPHRYPFLLVDRIVECTPGESAKGLKCVTANEPFFQGHFPGFKVMPGVLIIEALAQVGAVAILTREGSAGNLALFGGIKNARFKHQVRPGDVLGLSCQLTARKGPVGFGTAEARVDSKLACKAELTFALTDLPQCPR